MGWQFKLILGKTEIQNFLNMYNRYFLVILWGGIYALCLFASPARAEGNCPTGSYPTHDQNGNQNGCYPVYDPNQGPPEAPAPTPGPPPKPFSTLAIAWHPEVRAFWAIYNYDPNTTRDGGVEQACELQMGEGCMLIVQERNLAVVIGEAPDGSIYRGNGPGGRAEKARADLANYCKKIKTTCRTIGEFAPETPTQYWQFDPKFIFPNDTITPPNRRLYSAAYWSKEPGSKGKVYIATGKPAYVKKSWATDQPGERTAQFIAEDMMCRRAERGYCFGKYSGNVNFIMAYRDVAGNRGVVGGTDKADVLRQANAICMDNTDTTCAATTLVDARAPTRLELDWASLDQLPVESPATIAARKNSPRFGAGAWPLPKTPEWRGKIFVSGGHTSFVSASQAALKECRMRTGLECREAFALKLGFALVYKDTKGNIYTSRNSDRTVLTAQAAKYCKDKGTVCSEGVVFDSRNPGTKMIDVTSMPIQPN
jgi:hypothetical protein